MQLNKHQSAQTTKSNYSNIWIDSRQSRHYSARFFFFEFQSRWVHRTSGREMEMNRDSKRDRETQRTNRNQRTETLEMSSKKKWFCLKPLLHFSWKANNLIQFCVLSAAVDMWVGDRYISLSVSALPPSRHIRSVRPFKLLCTCLSNAYVQLELQWPINAVSSTRFVQFRCL